MNGFRHVLSHISATPPVILQGLKKSKIWRRFLNLRRFIVKCQNRAICRQSKTKLWSANDWPMISPNIVQFGPRNPEIPPGKGYLKNGLTNSGILSTMQQSPASKVYRRLDPWLSVKNSLRHLAHHSLNFYTGVKKCEILLLFFNPFKLPRFETGQQNGNLQRTCERPLQIWCTLVHPILRTASLRALWKWAENVESSITQSFVVWLC